MEEILSQVNELISKNKIKKALTLIKKVNSKNVTYGSLDLEGVCYFHNNQFALAITRFEKALKITPNNIEKIRVLSNLASAHIKSNNKEKALDCFIAALQLDPSANNAQTRLKICQLACELEKFDLVLEYGEKLRLLTDYSNEALHLLLIASFSNNDNVKKEYYSTKLLSECVNFSSASSQKFLNLMYLANDNALGNKLLELLKPKHNHEKWFAQFSQIFNPQQQTIPLLDNASIPAKKVIGSNKKLVKLINRLFENNIEHGASFHPRLRVFEENNNLSIKVFSNNQSNERLLDIPLKCMPLLNDYEISLTDDDLLVTKPKSNMLNPSAQETMQLMVEIYNESQKIKAWKACCPFFTLQSNPSLLDKLVSGKEFNQKVQNFNILSKNNELNILAIESFFGSRTFSYEQKALSALGIVSERPIELGLLSIIDFLNHKVKTNYYNLNQTSLSVSGQPDLNNAELFVHYNNYDPFLTYLIYGFIDTQAPWFFSVPITVQTSDNTSLFILGNSTTQSTDNISENGDYLADFAPDIVTLEQNKFQIDKMVIPAVDNSVLLTETLKMILMSIDKDNSYLNDTKLMNEVSHLEKQIILKNYHYWLEVKKLNTPENNDVSLLVNTALNHLTQYAKYNGISLF
ncbi:tetratricopeptide repeat protein [Pseudoalteromonas tunicata]|jgi:tetratricopeptide (TPR) repeat protein|uniref:Uncharacterized protein n=1 Tax=Pseudoalteromonas tunicata D2 TaxID=87626 RepID=A4C8I0_9GAMM|nr:tetratricopeptide repeat protein [Pseudoalteromonas tunicata]ATC93399.1 hypothetical protein PTUN_a0633 [Pseudoalteromonas tunicata]AXT32441.1 tetratricopeptide repeat protein [Pseudoalteromonas tunicata]EAR28895.1 hypothetical protein PTD2_07624 [Pseudoalteromonas tunicata D2]